MTISLSSPSPQNHAPSSPREVSRIFLREATRRPHLLEQRSQFFCGRFWTSRISVSAMLFPSRLCPLPQHRNLRKANDELALLILTTKPARRPSRYSEAQTVPVKSSIST
jgi:hypothetical protein